MSDKHPAISRRNVLILGGVAIVAGAVPASFSYFEPDSDQLADNLVSLLGDRKAAARLGLLWAENGGKPREPKAIAATIAKRLQPLGWSRSSTPEATRDAIAARIRQDYARNDMISVAGWQLARTGAELCALAASLDNDEADEAEHG
jgi:hypothetical protein